MMRSFEYMSLIPSLRSISPSLPLSLAFTLANHHSWPLHLPSALQILGSTAELDNFFSPQHVAANARRVHSPNSEQSTSSSSEPDTTSSRPKLSDALSHLTFSPKRPRSPALPVHLLLRPGPTILPAEGRPRSFSVKRCNHLNHTGQLQDRLPFVCRKWIPENVSQHHALGKSVCECKTSTWKSDFSHLHLPQPTQTSQD